MRRDPSAADVGALDAVLLRAWSLGRNVVLAWSEAQGGIDVLVVPHYLPGEILIGAPGAAQPEGARAAIRALIEGSKRLAPAALEWLARVLGVAPLRVEMPPPVGADGVAAVEATVRRYGISHFEDRAVVLLDIVGFSRLTPLVQMTQVSSLAYSINAAHDMLRRQAIDVELARTTTGDGYYVWNRMGGIRANVNLYHHMHLVLAENAIARAQARAGLVPHLKAAFHIGGHYEFYQAEALHPTRYSYIVGDVTIELARIMEHARPGQVLVGDFRVSMPLEDGSGAEEEIDSVGFIERLQGSLDRLHGLEISGERIESLKCYLTGPPDGAGGYAIERQTIVDKHGGRRVAYNAKVNIYRRHGTPIFLGLQHRDLAA